MSELQLRDKERKRVRAREGGSESQRRWESEEVRAEGREGRRERKRK